MIALRIMIIMGMNFLCIHRATAMEPSSWLNAGLTVFVGGVHSAVTTVTNQVSDEAAFTKLGFPPSDSVNKAELDKSKAIIERHQQAILENRMNDIFLSDAALIDRRQAIIKRVIACLPTHPKAIELAIFCLEHYQPVMNSFEISRLVTFVKARQECSKQEAQKLTQQLEQLVVVTESKLFVSALKGSGVQIDDNDSQKAKNL